MSTSFRYLLYPLELGTGKSTTIPDALGEYRVLLGNRVQVLQPARRTHECVDECLDDCVGEGKTPVKYHAELVGSLQSAQSAIRGFNLNALVGGDCSSDYALIPVMRERYADLAVIWIDTHADLNSPLSTPSRNFHGMVLRSLLGDSTPELAALNPHPLLPAQLIYVGLRETDVAEAQFIGAHTLCVLGVDALAQDPELLAKTVRAKGFAHVHVHLDVDVLDAREFRSTGFASEGGMRVDNLCAVLRALHAQTQLVSFAITEYAPQGVARDAGVIRAVWRALTGEWDQECPKLDDSTREQIPLL
jgi:arginase